MFSLQAKIRQVEGRKVKELRKKGLLPAVCYGHKVPVRSLVLPLNNFEKVYQQAGESSLIDLVIDKAEPVKVLIHDLQKDPTTDKIIHVDFYQVRAGQKITTEIGLKFIGESRVVREEGGTLMTNIDGVEVECLSKDLVSEIEVDVSALETFDAPIRIKDLKVPPGLKVKDNPEEVVVMVERPKTEEKLKEELEVKPEEKLPAEEAEKPEEEEEKKKEEAKKAEEQEEKK